LLQPTTMLEIIAYHSSTKNIQYLRDYNFCYSYHNLQQQVVKNSIALFSVEFLLRLLPENAPLHDLFIFCEYYFQLLDKFQENEIANFPLFFIAQSSKLLGYELKGKFSQETPYLNIPEGGFSNQQSLIAPVMTVENGQLLHNLLMCKELEIISSITMNATIRMQSLEWYLSFLHYHTQHISQLKSLQVLRTILH
jgi:DNA repair protein RecO (recombination protein O)